MDHKADLNFFDYSRYFFYLFIFTLPIPHSTAINNVGFYGCFVLFLISILRKELIHPTVDKVFFLILFAYVFIAFFGSFLHIETIAISLKAIKAHLFEQIFTLIYVLYFIKNYGKIINLIVVMAASYIFITIAPLHELIGVYFSAGWKEALNIRNIQLFDNYGINSQFYFPVLLGMAFIPGFPRKIRRYVFGVSILCFCFSILYETVTAVVLIFLYAFFLFFYKSNSKSKIFSLVVLFLFLAFFPYADKLSYNLSMVESGNKYQLLSHRVAIWDVSLDCALDAPVYGYGYGQKKIKHICTEGEYIENAEKRGNSYGANYFDKGKINFHNVYIESLFTTGWLGLFLLIGLFLYTIFLSYGNENFKEINKFLVIPIIIVFVLGSLMNGIWEGYAISKALMVFIGIGVYQGSVSHA